MRLVELSNAERKKQAGVEHDQFFTRPEVASRFSGWVKSQPWFREVKRVIEPAAGARALSRHFPGAEEYDLHPTDSSITKQDFLTSDHHHGPNTLVVMNPPFGAKSDLAIAFFNKAATFADYIAQIVPRTFRRDSIQGRLDSRWELVDEWVLPKGSFYLPSEGKEVPYHVEAVAQIWKRASGHRDVTPPSKVSGQFQFVRPEVADFAIRMKGRRAGQIVDVNLVTNPRSFFYVKGNRAEFERVDWSQYGNDVMGARSLSQAEIVKALDRQEQQ